jgi:hypothetical protein
MGSENCWTDRYYGQRLILFLSDVVSLFIYTFCTSEKSLADFASHSWTNSKSLNRKIYYNLTVIYLPRAPTLFYSMRLTSLVCFIQSRCRRPAAEWGRQFSQIPSASICTWLNSESAFLSGNNSPLQFHPPFHDYFLTSVYTHYRPNQEAILATSPRPRMEQLPLEAKQAILSSLTDITPLKATALIVLRFTTH